MFFKSVFDDSKIIQDIYKNGRLKRYFWFFVGVVMQAIAFSLFILPSNMVFGVSGVAVILKSVLGISPSVMIFIINVLLIIASFAYLGGEVTKHTIIGALLYPILVAVTDHWTINLGTTEPVIVALTGATLFGLGTGLVFRGGYTTGGTDVLKQIVAKYVKTSMGQSTIYVEGIIVVFGIFIFGWQSFIYSVLSIAVISVITDKVMLGISEYKSFQIITSKEKEIKQFIFNQLHHGVAIIENRSDTIHDRKHLVMCTVPTKEYFILKEAIMHIDSNASFIVTDTYEVNSLD